ncbi:MAG: carboxypeptidase-like regulatory domain-containing protein [bacterium]
MFNRVSGTALLICLVFSSVSFAQVAVTNLEAVDELLSSRSNFSSAEKIGFKITANNTSASSSRIQFDFTVKNPAGKQVFSQRGNSVPGSAGQSGTSIRNVLVSKFFTTSGAYTVTGKATLNGISSQKSATFIITAPMLTLSYPSNGAKNLSDKPLIFRWVGTGASKYKIYVDDDRSFFNALFVAETTGLSYTYPSNPANQQQRLVSGQVYYWKVEGLDASGNKISEASIPYSFSLSADATSSSTKDAGITNIRLSNIAGYPGHVPIGVTVENKGGRSISNIDVVLNVNGLSVEPSQKIPSLNSGQKKELIFQYRIVNFNEPLICVATLDIYDDDVNNNKYVKRLAVPDKLVEGKAKIHGKIVVKNTTPPKKVERAQVFFHGPKQGYEASVNGVYKIENLPPGEYSLWVKAEGYEESVKRTVNIEKEKSYTNVDFELKALSEETGSEPSYISFNLNEAWRKLKLNLSANTLKDLEGFIPYWVNDKELLKNVIEGKAEIKKESIK